MPLTSFLLVADRLVIVGNSADLVRVRNLP
jgi:hypothetical protein